MSLTLRFKGLTASSLTGLLSFILFSLSLSTSFCSGQGVVAQAKARARAQAQVAGARGVSGQSRAGVSPAGVPRLGLSISMTLGIGVEGISDARANLPSYTPGPIRGIYSRYSTYRRKLRALSYRRRASVAQHREVAARHTPELRFLRNKTS